MTEEEFKKLNNDLDELKNKVQDSKLLTNEEFYDIIKNILSKNSVGYNEIKSNIITGTTSGSIGTETTHAHYLPREPKFIFITPTLGATVYLTDKDITNIKVKSTGASTTFEAFCIL